MKEGMGMDVGLSTASFYPDALTEDALELAAELGVRKVEVFLESYSEYSEDFCGILLETLQRHHMDAYSIHVLSTQYEPQLFAATERQRRDAREIFEKVLKCAKLLGASTYVFHGPAVRINTRPQLDFSRIGDITDELAELSGEYGVKFAWENVFWCWYSFPEFSSMLMEHTQCDNLYFTLDIKQAMKSGGDPLQFLHSMGDQVCNVHVCDYDSEGELYIPGRGTFDFNLLREELRKQQYGGPIIMEVYRGNYQHYQDMGEALGYLQRIFHS